SGGLFRDMLGHACDAIRWVTGREVVEVYAAGGNRGAAFWAGGGDVDAGAALLTLDDGRLATVSGSGYNPAGYDVRLELFGSADSIAVGLDDRLPLRSAEPGVSFPAGPAYPNFLERFRPAYVRELAAFLDVAAARVDSPCPVADALAAFRVAEACELSRRERRPVQGAEGGAGPGRPGGWPRCWRRSVWRRRVSCLGGSAARCRWRRSGRDRAGGTGGRCADLLGGVRGPGLGLPARPGAGARRDAVAGAGR